MDLTNSSSTSFPNTDGFTGLRVEIDDDIFSLIPCESVAGHFSVTCQKG